MVRGFVGIFLELAGHHVLLQRDAGHGLLQRIVQFLRHPRPFRQDARNCSSDSLRAVISTFSGLFVL